MNKFLRFGAVVAAVRRAMVHPGPFRIIRAGCLALCLGAPVASAQVSTTSIGLVRHGLTINSSNRVEGSLQILTGENVTLNGSPVITGDLLVPGTPTISFNGNPSYGGTLQGTGSAQPTNYSIIGNGHFSLRHVIVRTNPISLPAVAPPPQPAGTRDVTLTNATQNPGNYATIRNLTLNGSTGNLTVPPGTYGQFTINGNNSITIGVAGATQPSVYNFQRLLFNGGNELRVVGPVMVTVNGAVTANGKFGSSASPAWLKLQLASGDFVLNGGKTVHADVLVPSGTVRFNGNCQLVGSLKCDRLLLNGNNLLRFVVHPVNHSPEAAEQNLIAIEDTVKPVVLAGSDVDGDPLNYTVVLAPSHGALSGTSPNLIYTPAANYHGPDSFTFKANDGWTDSAVATVSITVTPLNDRPTAAAQQLVTNEDTVLPIILTGEDIDGDNLTFAIVDAPQHGVLSGTAPNLIYTPAADFHGADAFTFAVSDAELSSSPAIVRLTVNPVNDRPIIHASAPAQITAPEIIGLNAVVSDDGDPAGSILTVRWSKISGPGDIFFSDQNQANTTASYTQGGTYVLRARASDGELSATDDVEVTVRMPNRPPVVSAGANQTTNLNAAVSLIGSAQDDGLPEGATVTQQWSKVSGPGTVTFGNATALATTASFDAPGDYVLRLRASDSALFGQAHMTVHVLAPNQPPQVNAGPAENLPAEVNTASLAGSVTDDGLPRGPGLQSQWSKVSGPGEVSFGNVYAAGTSATFSESGTYVLRLSATDGELSASAETQVVIAPRPNQAPVVNAGADQELIGFGSAVLQGTVTDDGLPAGNNLTQQWTKVSGPGDVIFSDASAGSTAATFSDTGIYVVRLTADDSALTEFDEITVTVDFENQPPAVDAGLDQAGHVLSPVTLSGEVIDDGLPTDAELTVTWSKVSGPGTITFSNASSNTTSATFSDAGVYVLQLSANDSELTASDQVTVQISSACTQPPGGLVGWWSGNGNAQDAAGTSHGTLLNEVTFSTGKVGDAFTLNGSSAVRAPANSVTDVGVSSGFTIELWINPNNAASQQPLVEWNNGSAIGAHLWLSTFGEGNLYANIVDRDGGTHNFYAPAGLITSGSFQHVALTYDRVTGLAVLYKDGQVAAQQHLGNYFTPQTSYDLYFGHRPGYSFTGKLDEVSLYQRALRQDEIQTIYQASNGGKCTDAINRPPSVQAGIAQAIPVSYSLQLQGSVSDDGRPAGAPISSTWTMVSGPGTAFFVDGSLPTTNVIFSTPGTYVLRLTATDSELTTHGDVTISVVADDQPVPSTVTITPYQAPDWRYKIYPLDGVPLDAGAVAFDDSDYALGQGAFGSGGGCAVQTTVHTNWPTFSEIVLRRTIDLPTNVTNVRVSGTVDNDVRIMINGADASGGFIGHEGCAQLDDTRINVVTTSLTPGPNLFVVHGRDRGGESFVDVRLLVDQPVTADAGPDATVAGESIVTLDGSESTAFSGSPLTFQWAQIGGPAVPLDVSDPVHPQFVAPTSSANTVFAFRLIVNDGRITSRPDTVAITVLASGVDNLAPVVNAGPDQTLPSSTATLQGAVQDDDIPSPAVLTVAWTAVSGPGPVSFANANDPATSAQFTRPGIYTLRLSASDSQLAGSDDIIITVPPGVNLPPSVNAGPDQTVTFPQTVSLSAQVSDDGLPNGTLTSRWTLLNGPGQATFGNAFAASTVASFTVPGTYVLRLIASDSVLGTTDDLTVTVVQAGNQPPTADAGADQTIPYGQSVTLTGLADDDGLPNGWIIIRWSLLSGPAVPQFGGTFDALTVTFSRVGAYALRFTADDGEFTASDDIIVTVTPSITQPPLISLTAPTQNAVFNAGQPITLTATATDPDAEGAVLSVEFYADGSLLGAVAPDANGSARYDWHGASLGAHSLTVLATDISGTPATSESVNISVQTARPTVELTYPSNYSAFAPGEPVQLHATATAAPGASITSVEFMVNGALVGSDAASPYATMWTTPETAGEYTLTAIANDEAGQTTSAPVLIRVVTDPDEPLVAELDPALAGMVVTAPTTLLGTVSGATLASWIVEYRQTGIECADWITLATGAQAVAGPLATLDPTLLLNGTHELRLTARNAFGGVSTDARFIVDGNMKVGNFTATFKDMELPLAGVPITVTRTYDSRNHCPGDFGYGWTLDVDSIRLESTEQMGDAWSLFIHVGTPYDPSYYRLDDAGPHLVNLKMPGGQLLRFTPKLVMDRPYNRLASLLDADGDDIGQVYAPIQDDQPIKMIYRARAGTEGAALKARGYRTISPFGGVGTVSGDTQLFLADTFEGAISLATQPGQFGEAPAITHVTGWEVTLKDGRVLLFDADGKLEEMRDRIGNKVTFHRLSSGKIDRITHLPSEKEIVFVRDTASRIRSITDPAGHAVQYRYTTNGDLDAVFERGNNPVNNQPTTSFTYKGVTHLLEDILDARGIRAAKNFYDDDGRLYKTIDAEGKETIFTHDLNTRTETIRDRANNITVHRYDERGNIIQTQAPDGTITTTGYHRWSDGTLSELKETESVTGLFTDENNPGSSLVTKILTTFYSYEDDDPATPPANDGLVRKLIDPKGNTTTFTYDERANVLTVTDAKANAAGGTPAASVVNTYYANGLLETVTDALGQTTTYTYDAQGNPDTETRAVTLINADGSSSSVNIVTDRDYNTLGQLERLTNPAGHVTTYEYDANGNRRFERTTRTTSTGTVVPVVTETEYDEQDRPVFTWNADNPRGQAARPSSQTVYDGNGKVEWTYDPLGRGTHQEYDSRGLLFKTTHPDNTFETVTYDPEGRREISRDRRAMATQTVYDPMSRVSQTIFLGDGSEPAVTLSTTRYDAAGRVWQSVDANNNTTTYGYDDAGRRATVVSPPVPLSGGGTVSPTTRYSYDANGNLRFFTDPKGAVTEHLYDALNRRWKTILPAAALDVNGDGLIGSGEQSVASTLITGYDELGRRASETDASNRTKRYGCDVLGRLRHVLDFANQATRFDYDELGNQLSQTDASQHTTRYSYDNVGRRLTRTLPLGQQEVLGYDDAGNLQTRRDFNGKTTTFQYDPMNRLRLKIPDASLGEPTIEFTYNNNGQRETMSDATGTTVYGYDGRGQLRTKQTPFGSLSYTYWTNGSLRQMWSSNANGINVSYGYDALNRLGTVADANAGTTSYGYDRNSNLESVLYPNSVNHAYGYNALNRLTGLSVAGPTGTLAGYGYVATPAGQRTSVSEGTGRTAGYGYDNLGRLQRETITGSPDGKNGMATYGYDNVGNRLTRTSSIAGITNQSFGYDSNDRLNGDQYDNNGNTVAGTASQPLNSSTPQPLLGTDSYDGENRLIQRFGAINGQPSTINLTNDGDGNRVREIVNGQVTTYLIDDRNPTGYAQVMEEIVNGTVNHTYTYGHDLISQDQFDPATNDWHASFYAYDGRGNVRFLTNETGAVTDTYTYDAFGTLITTTGSTNNRYLYGGEQFDPNLGLYYQRARLMNPLTGRFWTQDNYEGSQSDPVSLHKYLYADTDPTNRSDPSGNFSLVEVNTATTIATTTSGAQANVGFALLNQIEGGGNAGFESLATDAAILVGGHVAFRVINGVLTFLPKKVPATIALTRGRTAVQEISKRALSIRNDVEAGVTLYRIGTRGHSAPASDAQYWALEHPSTPGYARRHGIPPENVENANFIETATWKEGSPFVVRQSPPPDGMPHQPDAAYEVVVAPGGVMRESVTEW